MACFLMVELGFEYPFCLATAGWESLRNLSCGKVMMGFQRSVVDTGGS